MLDALLEFTTTGHVPPIFEEAKSNIPLKPIVDLPERMEGMTQQLHIFPFNRFVSEQLLLVAINFNGYLAAKP